MSEQIKGVIEGVSCKEGNDHPKYGVSYQTSIKVGGEWYGAFTKKTDKELGLEKGKLVTFTYTENGKYKNYDPKSLTVSAAAKSESSGSSASGKSSGGYGGNSAGIKVGHAINNAVALVASGKVPVEGSILRTIHTQAVAIIALSVKLEGQFDAIVGKAAEVYDKSTGSAATESEAPAAKTTTPKAKAAAAKPKAKPAPAPEPEPEAEEEDDAPPVQQEKQAEPDFDDDIPF